MTNRSWSEELHHARVRPAMYIGPQRAAHLTPAIERSLQLVWLAGAFQDPGSGHLTVSPNQFQLAIQCGPFIPPIDALGRWRQSDVMVGELLRLGQEISAQSIDGGQDWAQEFRYLGLSALGCALMLARRGFIAVRTSEGVWHQVYFDGWPATAPSLVRAAPGLGFAIGAALDSRWFTGLPYTRETAENVVPMELRHRVTVEWRARDEIIPEDLFEHRNEPDWLLPPLPTR
jgi:hypothetical protein